MRSSNYIYKIGKLQNTPRVYPWRFLTLNFPVSAFVYFAYIKLIKYKMFFQGLIGYNIPMSTVHNLSKSFSYAFQGISTAFKNEPNLKIHLSVALLATGAGFVLGLNRIEWIILAFTIVLVIILELMNTMLESLVDLVSPEMKTDAKIAKDVSAAMVLVSAIFSVIVGILLFTPKIF
jgi:diacylglycerol kinase